MTLLFTSLLTLTQRKKSNRLITALMKYDVELYKVDITGYDDVGSMIEEYQKRKEAAMFMSSDNYLYYRALAHFNNKFLILLWGKKTSEKSLDAYSSILSSLSVPVSSPIVLSVFVIITNTTSWLKHRYAFYCHPRGTPERFLKTCPYNQAIAEIGLSGTATTSAFIRLFDTPSAGNAQFVGAGSRLEHFIKKFKRINRRSRRSNSTSTSIHFHSLLPVLLISTSWTEAVLLVWGTDAFFAVG